MSIEAVNTRNQFKGRIREVVDSAVVSEVVVETGHGSVVSVISTRSVRELNLKIGTKVLTLVKATDIALAKLYPL